MTRPFRAGPFGASFRFCHMTPLAPFCFLVRERRRDETWGWSSGGVRTLFLHTAIGDAEGSYSLRMEH